MLINIKKLSEITTLSPSMIYKLVSQNQFPQPIKLGAANRWRMTDIQNYINSL